MINKEFYNIKFDSDEELHFAYYLEELKDKGFIKSWDKNIDPLELTDGILWKYKYLSKNGVKTKTQNLMRSSVYTYDWNIYWEEKAHGIFVTELDEVDMPKISTPFVSQGNISRVETKGDFDKNNMTRLAINNIKFIWYRHSIFISLIKVPTIFKETFTPRRYLTTDRTRRMRRLKYGEVRTLSTFVKLMEDPDLQDDY